MSWGAYWMFYRCPACGGQFKSALDRLEQPHFGHCPLCGAEGELVGESGNHPPDHQNAFVDTD